MSINPTITANDVIKYLGTVLNIDTNSKLTIADITEDLKNIHDLGLFRVFIKQNFMNKKYQYFTGYQKFLILVKDFKEQMKPKLTDEAEIKVVNFSEKLYKKTVAVFEEVNWNIQLGKSLLHFNMEKSFDEKELQVLNQIGNKQILLNLVKHGKYKLEQKIEKAIRNLTLRKHYPQLAHKSQEQLVLENLANRVN